MAEEDLAEEESPKKEKKCEECKPGAPLWMATFADMATLLMAFFVLILSFAEVKQDKYKAVAGSLANAFGMPKVQIIPKATTMIDSEFSPSIEAPTPLNQMVQKTENADKEQLDRKQKPDEKDFDSAQKKREVEKVLQKEIADGQVEVRLEGDNVVVQQKGNLARGSGKQDTKRTHTAGIVSQKTIDLYAKIAAAEKVIQSQIEIRDNRQGKFPSPTGRDPKAKEKLAQVERKIADKIADLNVKLAAQVEKGLVKIERRENQVIVQLGARGSFGSGGADINPNAVKALKEIRDVMMQDKGSVTVAGHTDNTPILNHPTYRSNWDLSSARAAAVADTFTTLLGVPRGRMQVEGFGDTRPINNHNTQKNREANRRIEIIMDVKG